MDHSAKKSSNIKRFDINKGESSECEGLTWPKVSRFISLPFSPSRTKTFMQVKRFEDVSIDRLFSKGVEGILLDADGTLGPHHIREFNSGILNHVRAMLEKGFKIAIYTNASKGRFQQFQDIGVEVVHNVPAKPDPSGFHIAMTKFLKLEDPNKVCMIGDNYVTDGGAIDAGMHFIHVQPVKGNELFFHSATRLFAYLCAKMQGQLTEK
jgi:predicted HAD superfamily phosphohydrolase YqeG